MKKLILIIAVCILSSSCATIFGGKITHCQKTKPLPGNESRQIRIVPFIFDLWNPIIFLTIDFATGAIYKPCEK